MGGPGRMDGMRDRAAVADRRTIMSAILKAPAQVSRKLTGTRLLNRGL